MTAKHLKFIDTLPCIVCGTGGNITHHHLLRVDKKYLTPTPETEGLMFPKIKSKGMGTKSDDRFCLPICPRCHGEAHRYGNDKEYFKQRGLEHPEELALAFWRNSGNFKACYDLIKWRFLGTGKCSGLRNFKK